MARQHKSIDVFPSQNYGKEMFSYFVSILYTVYPNMILENVYG